MSTFSLSWRFAGSLLLCLACAVGVWSLASFAVHTARGQRLDQMVLTAGRNDDGPIAQLVFPVLNTVSIPVVLVALVAAIIVALVRRRFGTALHMVLLVGGAALTTEILKEFVITRESLAPGLEVTPNSYPSGHATLAASITLAVVLAVPPRLRSLVAILGAGWTAAASIGTIASGWHRPSDVIGALLVVGAWSFLVLALDAFTALARDREGQAKPLRLSGGLALVVLAAVGIVGLAGAVIAAAALPLPLALDDPADQLVAYGATALTVTGLVAVLVSTLLALRVPELPRSDEDHRVR
ncbi:MAG: phosphatase PAP2 family protein [Brachybacterium sp.]|nr:phosphatase PAP2 family protein [Brachybacterium sp.]